MRTDEFIAVLSADSKRTEPILSRRVALASILGA